MTIIGVPEKLVKTRQNRGKNKRFTFEYTVNMKPNATTIIVQ